MKDSKTKYLENRDEQIRNELMSSKKEEYMHQFII